jgi:hypothetical protein
LFDNKEFLYELPLGTPVEGIDRIKDWHKRMASRYRTTDLKPYSLLHAWLKKFDVPQEEMPAYGIDSPLSIHYSGHLIDEFHKRILDNGRVIKRRAGGALYVLGEPYGDLEKVEKDPYVAAWRSIGASVMCSNDSGWMPGRTVSVLIQEPMKAAHHD